MLFQLTIPKYHTKITVERKEKTGLMIGVTLYSYIQLPRINYAICKVIH